MVHVLQLANNANKANKVKFSNNTLAEFNAQGVSADWRITANLECLPFRKFRFSTQGQGVLFWQCIVQARYWYGTATGQYKVRVPYVCPYSASFFVAQAPPVIVETVALSSGWPPRRQKEP